MNQSAEIINSGERTGVRAKRALVLVMLVYGVICIRKPDVYRLLDSVDLPIHETGHLVFGFMGEFMMFLGGTLFQLIVPITFVVYFWRRHDRFAASVVMFWVAQNCWNIARYVEDARAQRLPLVGGGEHDWAYLLGVTGLLRHDQDVGLAVRVVGFLVFVASVCLAWLSSDHYSTSSNVPDSYPPAS